MKLSWLRAHKQYQVCLRYEQYKTMQDIREIK